MTDGLAGLSVELMSDSELDQLGVELESLSSTFEQIHGLDTAQMVAQRDSLAQQLDRHCASIQDIYRREVPWLTIFSGQLENWITPAKDEYEKTRTAREQAEGYAEAAGQAAVTAREKAGEAGAAEFTAGYREQADSAEASAKEWLKLTKGLFGAAFALTILFVVLHALGWPKAPTSLAETLLYLSWRVGTIGLLFGGAIWCGRLFRAHTHNQEVNRHRATCLENMRAFHASVEDQGMKDVIALEFSRAATQGMPIGFISGRADARADSSQVLTLANKASPADE